MIKDIWLNLPVKNVKTSKEFFTQIGFKPNTHYGEHQNSASFFIGEKNVVLMLFDEASFNGFSGHTVTDTQKSTEVLFSFDAESKEEVDAMIDKVIKAGGTSNHTPSEMQGWMYGCLFLDPDGHRWNILHMDYSKMPKG